MKSVLFKVAIVALVLFVSVIFVGGFWAFTQLQPVDVRNAEQVTFVIPRGQAISVIGRRLQEEGLIKNPLVFRFIVWKDTLAGRIQAGSFDLSPSQSTADIARTLTKGTEDQWVTIPEGLRAEEIAELFTGFSQFDQEKFIAEAKPLEGTLFPDTYLFPQAATEDFVLSYLTNTFEKKTADLQEQVQIEGKSWAKTLTLASIVQREAKTASDMKLVAGILQNRLEINQALQVDATLQYIKGYDPITKKWWSPPLAVDKELNSPYNTYKFVGLPPAPICNPGVDAISAVINPTPSDYLYYIHAPNGTMYYAKTYDEHLKNVNMYLR